MRLTQRLSYVLGLVLLCLALLSGAVRVAVEQKDAAGQHAYSTHTAAPVAADEAVTALSDVDELDAADAEDDGDDGDDDEEEDGDVTDLERPALRADGDEGAYLTSVPRANSRRLLRSQAIKLDFHHRMVAATTRARALGQQTGFLLPHTAQLCSEDATQAFWLKINGDTDDGAWRTVLYKGAHKGERSPAIFIHPASRRLQVHISTSLVGDGGKLDVKAEVHSSTMALPLYHPTHVALVRNGKTVKLYLDGKLDSKWQLTGDVVCNDGPLHINPSIAGLKAFTGQLRDLRWYTSALRAAEVRNLNFAGTDSALFAVDYRKHFDGTSKTGLVVPHDDGLNTDDFTVAMWVNSVSDAGSVPRVLMHKGRNTGEYAPIVYVMPNSQKLAFSINTELHPTEGLLGTRALVKGQPTHVAVVRHGNVMRLYVDGALDKEVLTSSATRFNDGPVFVGRSPGRDEDNGFVGQMWGVRWYGDALDGNQISGLVQETSGDAVARFSAVRTAAGTAAAVVPVASQSLSTAPEMTVMFWLDLVSPKFKYAATMVKPVTTDNDVSDRQDDEDDDNAGESEEDILRRETTRADVVVTAVDDATDGNVQRETAAQLKLKKNREFMDSDGSDADDADQGTDGDEVATPPSEEPAEDESHQRDVESLSGDESLTAYDLAHGADFDDDLDKDGGRQYQGTSSSGLQSAEPWNDAEGETTEEREGAEVEAQIRKRIARKAARQAKQEAIDVPVDYTVPQGPHADVPASVGENYKIPYDVTAINAGGGYYDSSRELNAQYARGEVSVYGAHDAIDEEGPHGADNDDGHTGNPQRVDEDGTHENDVIDDNERRGVHNPASRDVNPLDHLNIGADVHMKRQDTRPGMYASEYPPEPEALPGTATADEGDVSEGTEAKHEAETLDAVAKAEADQKAADKQAAHDGLEDDEDDDVDADQDAKTTEAAAGEDAEDVLAQATRGDDASFSYLAVGDHEAKQAPKAAPQPVRKDVSPAEVKSFDDIDDDGETPLVFGNDARTIVPTAANEVANPLVLDPNQDVIDTWDTLNEPTTGAERDRFVLNEDGEESMDEPEISIEKQFAQRKRAVERAREQAPDMYGRDEDDLTNVVDFQVSQDMVDAARAEKENHDQMEGRERVEKSDPPKLTTEAKELAKAEAAASAAGANREQEDDEKENVAAKSVPERDALKLKADAIPDANILNLNTSAGNYTTKNTPFATELFRRGGLHQTTPSMLLLPRALRTYARVATDKTWHDGVVSSATLRTDGPNHVAYVLRDNIVRQYLNGRLDSELPLEGSVLQNDGPLRIAEGLRASGLAAQVTDFQFHERALRADELRQVKVVKTVAVHGYYNERVGDHMYSTTNVMKDVFHYRYEGVRGWIYAEHMPGTEPVYRFYNADIGDHRLSMNNLDEPSDAGYVYTGVIGYAYRAGYKGTTALIEYYNAALGDHFYTTDPDEVKAAEYAGYKVNSVAFYVLPEHEQPVPAHRYFDRKAMGEAVVDVSLMEPLDGKTPIEVSAEGINKVGARGFSVMMWLNVTQDSTGEPRVLMRKGATIGEQTPSMYLRAKTRQIVVKVNTADGIATIVSKSEVPLGIFTHVALVQRTTKSGASSLAIYINGREDAKRTIKSLAKPNNAPLLIGGGLAAEGAAGVKGMVEELRWYNRPVLVSEIHRAVSVTGERPAVSFEYAQKFDGSSDANYIVTIPHSNAMNQARWTLIGTVVPKNGGCTAATGRCTILHKGANGGKGKDGKSSGAAAPAIEMDTNGKLYAIVGGTVLGPSAASVADKPMAFSLVNWGKRVIFRVDGKLVGRAAASVPSNTDPLYLGSAPWKAHGAGFQGSVNELKWFTRAMSGAEVAEYNDHAARRFLLEFERRNVMKPETSVTVPHSDKFGSVGFTIAFWLKLAHHSPRDANIIAKATSGETAAPQVALRADGRIAVTMQSTTGVHEVLSDGRIPINFPTHVSVVRSGPMVKIYINGKLDNSGLSPSPLVTNTAVVTIGAGADMPGFYGWIRHLHWYGVEYKPNEILTEMRMTKE